MTSRRPWPVIGPVPALAVAGAIAAAVVAHGLGFAPEWDLLNYHLYNPHALLAGRLAIDIAPAQMQSFLNPLFHLPHYLMFRYLGPEWLVGVTGMVQGLQLPLLYVLAARLTSPVRPSPVVLGIVALLGFGGPVFLSELGGTQGDTVLSALVLGGLLLALPGGGTRPAREAQRRMGLAGGLLGAAVALKLTFGIYAVAIAVAVALLPGHARRWRLLAALAGGGCVGVLLFGGPWFAWLWHAWDNPLFPYFNQVFRSDWLGAESFRDLRFMPRSAGEWLAYPAVWLQDPQRVWEWPFRDLRVIAVLPACVLIVAAGWRRLSPDLRFTAVFVLAAYAVWLPLFSIYRYLSVVEMLAPLVLFAAMVQIRPSRITVGSALALLLASQLVVDYERHRPLWELHPGQSSALQRLPDDALVLIDGYEPVGFAALWLDDDIPMIRVRANFMRSARPNSRLAEEAERRVKAHDGPVHLLLSPADLRHPHLREDLARLGFAMPGEAGCIPLFDDAALQRRIQVRVCVLRREIGRVQLAGRWSIRRASTKFSTMPHAVPAATASQGWARSSGTRATPAAYTP